MMSDIYASIACNLDADILMAALPLLEDEKVEAIEWSFDTLFKIEEVPAWFTDLVREFSDQNRLIGHGVYFSLFSGKWSDDQRRWLQKLEKLSHEFRFDHITEHFGFMTGEDFHKGAPIGVPLTPVTLAIGKDRLKRMQDACKCPVGLENLAFSYSVEEVRRHGDFLDQLVQEVNGFIILDLHNLYCQSHNFGIGFEEMINLYPLERVREIHISGGSWDDRSASYNRIVRRDTHDDAVPEEVFRFLESALPKCPNLKYVVLEQMGTALESDESRENFRNDFSRMSGIMKSSPGNGEQNDLNPFLPSLSSVLPIFPQEDILLHNQQVQLSDILETATSYHHAREMLRLTSLWDSEWNARYWEPYMLETAMAIAQKWRNGFS